jgi:hypothetical protein
MESYRSGHAFHFWIREVLVRISAGAHVTLAEDLAIFFSPSQTVTHRYAVQELTALQNVTHITGNQECAKAVIMQMEPDFSSVHKQNLYPSVQPAEPH